MTKKRVRMTKEKFEILLDHIRDAGTVRALIRSDKENWPSYRSIHRWITVNGHRDEYEAARRDSIFMLMDLMIDLSRAPAPDTGDNKLNHAEMTRRKQEIDTYKFLSAKMAGKLFANHQTVEHEGDGIQIQIMDYAKTAKE